MANPEHLKILEQGVEVWNRWRDDNPFLLPDLQGSDLSGLRFDGINLSGASLTHASLAQSSLSYAEFSTWQTEDGKVVPTDLGKADFREADLSGAIFHYSILGGANLSEADLSWTTLKAVRVGGTKMPACIMAGTVITEVSLAGIGGLESVIHFRPSSIAIDVLDLTARSLMLDRSRKEDVERFLRMALPRRLSISSGCG